MNLAYAYPWDIAGDPAAPERLAALGVDAVALAVSYHSTRAATPQHPAHRVLDVPHSAFYLPVRPEAWGRLVPAGPTWTAPDAYLLASEALRAAGLKVYAWTVLTHNAHLGQAHPDVVVRNAFGDRYPYALCPAWEDVADYCERLVREVVTAGEPDGLILEGCGAMGFGHQSVHEKTAGADFDAGLMSLCFCARCADRYPAGTRERVRAAIDDLAVPDPSRRLADPQEAHRPIAGETGSGPLKSVTGDTGSSRLETVPGDTGPNRSETIPGDTGPNRSETIPGGTGPSPLETALGPYADEVRAVRVELSASLRRRLMSAARELAPDLPIALHADPDPWATGPFAALPDGEQAADVLVGNCWGDPVTDAARLSRLGELCGPGQRVGAYVLALPPRPADARALAELLRTYFKAGASEIHLYHAGLASPRRLTAMADALRLAGL